MRFVFYWHVVYMSLRYSLLFFHDEQSWNVKISFRNFENCKKLFARRTTSNNFFRHNVFFNNENQIDSEQLETKLNFLQNEVTIEFNAKKKTTMLRWDAKASKKLHKSNFTFICCKWIFESAYRFFFRD